MASTVLLMQASSLWAGTTNEVIQSLLKGQRLPPRDPIRLAWWKRSRCDGSPLLDRAPTGRCALDEGGICLATGMQPSQNRCTWHPAVMPTALPIGLIPRQAERFGLLGNGMEVAFRGELTMR